MTNTILTSVTQRLEPVLAPLGTPSEEDLITTDVDEARFDVESPLACAYLQTRAGTRLRNASVDTYDGHLQEFISFLYSHSVEVVDAELPNIIDYVEYCVDQDNRRSTIEGKLTTIREFYKFVHLRTKADLALDPLELDTIELDNYNMPSKIHREALTREDLRRLFDAMDSYRNRLLAIVGVETGLRNSDLRNIRISDVNFGAPSIHVRDPKNAKPYDVPISRNLGWELEVWCDEFRPGYDVEGTEDFLFPGQSGAKIETNGGLNQIIKTAAEDAGIQETLDTSSLTTAQQQALNTSKEQRVWHRVTVHTLRHTCLTLMEEDGVPLQYRQLVANHSDPVTTQRYSHGQEDEFAVVRDRFDPPR